MKDSINVLNSWYPHADYQADSKKYTQKA